MKKTFTLLITCFLAFACKKEVPIEQNCEFMKYGTFDVYQKDKKVGSFYRKDSIQVETYIGAKSTGLTTVRQMYKCQFQMKSYFVKQKLDTVNFTVNYKVIESNVVEYEMTPTFMNLDSKLKGIIK